MALPSSCEFRVLILSFSALTIVIFSAFAYHQPISVAPILQLFTAQDGNAFSFLNKHRKTTIATNYSQIIIVNPNMADSSVQNHAFKHRRDVQRKRKSCMDPVTFATFDLPSTALASFPGSGNTWVRHLLELITGKQRRHLIFHTQLPDW